MPHAPPRPVATLLALALGAAPLAAAPLGAQPWRPDLGDGRYRNPVVFADYYMTASST
jgi:hypothetical protein